MRKSCRTLGCCMEEEEEEEEIQYVHWVITGL